MAIAVKCTCGKSYSLPVEYSGKVAKCKTCGARVVIPIQNERLLDTTVSSEKSRPTKIHGDVNAHRAGLPRIVGDIAAVIFIAAGVYCIGAGVMAVMPRDAQARKIFNAMIFDDDSVSSKGSAANLLLEEFGDTTFVRRNLSVIVDYKKRADNLQQRERLHSHLESLIRPLLKDPNSLQWVDGPFTTRIVARLADSQIYGENVRPGLRCYVAFGRYSATNSFGGRISNLICVVYDESGAALTGLVDPAEEARKAVRMQGEYESAFLIDDSRVSDEWQPNDL